MPELLDAQIEKLREHASSRIEAAANQEELEAVRVEALGRKGFLANASKDFGKLRARGTRAHGQAAECR